MSRAFRTISQQIETIGIETVPEKERCMSPWRYFLVWFMASNSATTPVIGYLLFPLGLQGLLVAMACALVLGLVPAGLVTMMGRQVPLSALVIARRPFGSHGAMVLSALFTLINVVWFGLNSEVAGELLGAALPGGKALWIAVVGVVQTLLVLFGMHLLQAIYRVTSGILLVALGWLAYMLIENYHVDFHDLLAVSTASHASMSLAEGIAVILNFSLFAWTYKLSTVSRFCRPHGAPIGYFMAAPVGIMMSMVLMGVLGFTSQMATGSWNAGLMVADRPIVGPIVACLLGLAIIQTNALNLYPSTIDALVCLRTFRPAQWWQEPAATLLLGLLATTAALGGILSRITGLLTWVEHLIIPFTCILLLDWYGYKGHCVGAMTYLQPSTIRWRLTGCLAFALGVAASLVLPGHMPDALQLWLPEPIAVFMLTLVCFIAMKHIFEIMNTRTKGMR